jgi:hypothetical protein
VSQTDRLFALEYEAEAGWAENVSTFATHRIPCLGPIVPDFKQDMIEPERAVQQLQGGTAPILGPKSGTFRFRVHATGHGSATSGAVALTAMETFKGYGFGNPSLGESLSAPTRSAANGTTAAGGSTVSNVVTAASGTIARGSLVRLGAARDGRGGGKFYAVNNHTGTNLALRNDTQLALNAADVVHSAVNFYFPETIAGTAVKGLRFRFLYLDKQYLARGCWIQSITLVDTDVGQTPKWEFEVGVSEWDSTTGATFPSAVAMSTDNPSPVCGGALHVQDVGVTTRNERNARGFTLTIQTGIQPTRGHGGLWPYQTYVGAIRTTSKIRASWIEAVTDIATWETKYRAGTAQQLVASLSITAGSALGVHIQTLRLDKHPVLIVNDNTNAVQLEGYACAGTDTATELSQAAAVIAYA